MYSLVLLSAVAIGLLLLSKVREGIDETTYGLETIKGMYETQVGVALFKDHPNAMFPFSSMDVLQRQYVESVVATCMSQFQQRDAASAASSSSPSSSLKNTLSANVVMQMGGGCILYAENIQQKRAGAGPCGEGSSAVRGGQGRGDRVHVRWRDMGRSGDQLEPDPGRTTAWLFYY
jgi:hypothetical protein